MADKDIIRSGEVGYGTILMAIKFRLIDTTGQTNVAIAMLADTLTANRQEGMSESEFLKQLISFKKKYIEGKLTEVNYLTQIQSLAPGKIAGQNKIYSLNQFRPVIGFQVVISGAGILEPLNNFFHEFMYKIRPANKPVTLNEIKSLIAKKLYEAEDKWSRLFDDKETKSFVRSGKLTTIMLAAVAETPAEGPPYLGQVFALRSADDTFAEGGFKPVELNYEAVGVGESQVKGYFASQVALEGGWSEVGGLSSAHIIRLFSEALNKSYKSQENISGLQRYFFVSENFKGFILSATGVKSIEDDIHYPRFVKFLRQIRCPSIIWAIVLRLYLDADKYQKRFQNLFTRNRNESWTVSIA